MSATLKWKSQSCPNESPKFSRILNHIWNIHSLEPGFPYTFGISSCPRNYTNLQSFKRHDRDKHVCFFKMYLKVFDKDLPNNLNISQQDENDFSPVENIFDHEEYFETEEDFEHFDDSILSNLQCNILLELREHFNVTTKASCFIAEKMLQTIDSDRKLFSSVLIKSFAESGIREIGHQVNSLLKLESRYSTACKHFTGEKSLSNFVQNINEFIESQELIIGFDLDTEKNDAIQYAPILRTLKLLLSHDSILGEVFKETTEHTEVVIRSCNDGKM